MRIATGLPTLAPGTDGEFIRSWATIADQAGFSNLMARDRVVDDTKEPLIALTMAAAVTSRVGLLASTVIVPTREPVLLARQAASLDILSGGRLTLGVGVGYRQDDYAATGTEFHRRGRRVEEQLPVLRRIWAGEPAGPGIGVVGPTPPAGRPRLMIGGHVPAVAERIARWGEGYLATVGADATVQANVLTLWQQVLRAWDAAGREGRPQLVTGSYFALGPTAEADADRYIHGVYGFDPAVAARIRGSLPTTPDAVLRLVERQAALGADELILIPCAEELRSIEALSEAVRGVIPAAG